ncbi:hypothetical protein HELRODRAFT_190288 [Helobdella robusta]|uniref:Peptidase M12B domain-containing protein n=1 Tax=Helobdella robusta TaxID=6412 RepID=T1FRV2_HELRO|nr:hypothetical protein HELRODRAFT_190288 [Helobdella robusta]ESO11056.1 hypothetical protein HELRODRAFT_190288 [Helobdella robusta]
MRCPRFITLLIASFLAACAQRSFGIGNVQRNVVVDLMVITDFSIYTRWMRFHGNDERKAVDSIEHFYTHVVDGIARRYRNANIPGFNIKVVLAGIYISKNQTDLQFLESPDIRMSDKTIDGIKAYTKLCEWMWNDDNLVKRKFPKFDVAAVFTLNSMHNVDGIGAMFALCRRDAVYITREEGMYRAVDIGTHELGHILGANNDGQGNNCSPKDHYIMAPIRNSVTEENAKTFYSFSPCSVSEITRFLTQQYSTPGNCLAMSPRTKSQDDLKRHLTTKIGQRYSIDEQCQIIFGKDASTCGGGGELKSRRVCEMMFCWVPRENTCVHLSQFQKAADGTSCSSGMWCFDGLCRPDPMAPKYEGTCKFGDWKGRWPDGKVTRTCDEVMRQVPWRCYDDRVADGCCQTCATVKKKNENEKCPYSDKLSKSECSKSLCKDPKKNSLCCKTCPGVTATTDSEKDKPPKSTDANVPKKVDDKEKVNVNKQSDCPNGDTGTWCKTVSKYECYNGEKICCETCSKLRDNSRVGCEYGDKAPWCADYVRSNPGECKNPDTECCGKCPYSDKLSKSECSKSLCKDPKKNSLCCKTCPGVTATTDSEKDKLIMNEIKNGNNKNHRSLNKFVQEDDK